MKACREVSAYLSQCEPAARARLKRIRAIVRKVAPQAEEFLSYRMPAYRHHGVLLYMAAFKQHIGLYPPLRGDAALLKALARFAGPKGNLKFPLAEPMPYALIERLVKLRLKQNLAK
jgi:uncharacterized protein YdhG (YjbR/CyaY superfamily)